MKKNLLLYILLIFLIAVNSFFLFNYSGKTDRKDPKGPRDFIVKELQFDASQMEQFKRINKAHHDKIKVFSDNIGELKDILFNKISEASVSQQEIDSITTLIGKNEKEKDQETFYHFRAIQNMCNEDQKRKFNRLIKVALHREGRKPPPRPQH